MSYPQQGSPQPPWNGNGPGYGPGNGPGFGPGNGPGNNQPPQAPGWGGPPPPYGPRNRRPLIIGLILGVLLVGGFAVTAFAAPGFLVDDSEDSKSSDDPTSPGETTGLFGPTDISLPPPSHPDVSAPTDLPDVSIPPPNATDLTTGLPEITLPSGDLPTGSGPSADGAAEDFAIEFLSLVEASDSSGVDHLMCESGQEWQYEEAVSAGTSLTLENAAPDASAPGGILGELYFADHTLGGRITVVPSDDGGWCIDSFYTF